MYYSLNKNWNQHLCIRQDVTLGCYSSTANG